jgi:hypothetical protein
VKKILITASILAVSLFSISNVLNKSLAASNQPEPPLPSIPGITTEDIKPNSCVDCHKLYTEPRKFDGRLTTQIKGWMKKVEPGLLEKAQKAMPEGIKLEGKHPDVSTFVKVIPHDCLACHSSKSSRVPQFRQMIHLIHLTGEDNHFIKNFQGQCTYCHKLDKDTGRWGFGSGKAEW